MTNKYQDIVDSVARTSDSLSGIIEAEVNRKAEILDRLPPKLLTLIAAMALTGLQMGDEEMYTELMNAIRQGVVDAAKV